MITPTNQNRNEEQGLIRLISEIIQGYSTIRWNKQTLYIKHHTLTQHAQVLIDTEERKVEVQKRGIPTEEQAIKEAIERGDWSQEDEQYILIAQSKIDALTKAVDQLKITAQRKAQYEVIKELRAQMKDRDETRLLLLANTAEIVSSSMAYNDFLADLLYIDKKFVTKIDDSDIDITDFNHLRILQRVAYTKFDDFSISKAALSDFFKSILQFSDDPNKVFGKPISEISLFQMKLLSYGNLFHSIFKNVSDIPDFVKKDPEALIEFVNQRDNDGKVSRGAAESRKSTSGASTFFGASPEDIQKLKDSDERVVDFNKELKKRGGSMNMREMIELCGVNEN